MFRDAVSARLMEIGVWRSDYSSSHYHNGHYGYKCCTVMGMNPHKNPAFVPGSQDYSKEYYCNHSCTLQFPLILQSKPIPKVIVQQYFK